MPTVETTIRVSTPDDGATLGEVEQRVAEREAVQAARRELLLAACAALEEEADLSLVTAHRAAWVETRTTATSAASYCYQRETGTKKKEHAHCLHQCYVRIATHGICPFAQASARIMPERLEGVKKRGRRNMGPATC